VAAPRGHRPKQEDRRKVRHDSASDGERQEGDLCARKQMRVEGASVRSLYNTQVGVGRWGLGACLCFLVDQGLSVFQGVCEEDNL
jgi:hypothetical protein